jgi:flagellar motor component MotA
MNFETWWNSYQKELHKLFQDPWQRCEVEILARVKQVTQVAYKEGCLSMEDKYSHNDM